jgi:TRAP-type C4-dicarboxylate transport system permease small subunit
MCGVITGPLTIVFCFVLLRFVAQAWKDPQNITDQLSPKPEKPQ